jgi:cell division protein ZapA
VGRKEKPDVASVGIDSTAVTIFGRTYHLRGDDDSAYLAELAARVDRKMKEIAEVTGTADTLKVAILAALNLADECSEVRRTGASKGAGDRLIRLVTLLDEALLAG